MANVKRTSAPSKASDDAITPARSERVQRNLDWLATIGGVIARLADGEESSLPVGQAEQVLDEYLAAVEGARSVVRGTAGGVLRNVVVLRTMLRWVAGEPCDREPWVMPAVWLDLNAAREAPKRRNGIERSADAMATVAADWDPRGLGTVPAREWKTLASDYIAAAPSVRSRGVRKRSIRDREDVVFEFLRDHGLTQATTAKNLRDATASASRPRKQTR